MATVMGLKIWKAGTECDWPGYDEFKEELNRASFHNAGSNSEANLARTATRNAAVVASNYDWPYWAMERMFKEIRPLVAWESFMQNYINVLKGK